MNVNDNTQFTLSHVSLQPPTKASRMLHEVGAFAIVYFLNIYYISLFGIGILKFKNIGITIIPLQEDLITSSLLFYFSYPILLSNIILR